jgi:hypothetical protein
MIEKKEIFKLLESVISRTSDLEEQKYILMDLIIHYFSESQDFTKVAQQICSDFNIDLPEQIKSEIEKQKQDEETKKLDSVNKQLFELQKLIEENKKNKEDRQWFPISSPDPAETPYPGKFKGIDPYWRNPDGEKWSEKDFKYKVTCDGNTKDNENYYKYQQYIADGKFKIMKNDEIQ